MDAARDTAIIYRVRQGSTGGSRRAWLTCVKSCSTSPYKSISTSAMMLPDRPFTAAKRLASACNRHNEVTTTQGLFHRPKSSSMRRGAGDHGVCAHLEAKMSAAGPPRYGVITPAAAPTREILPSGKYVVLLSTTHAQ